jgi:hypothetical protein
MTHRTRAIIMTALLAAALGGCASEAPEAEVETETVGSSPSAEPTPEPTPEPTMFTTRNGTATFLLPVGWTVEDTSVLDPTSNHGGPIWQNVVALLDDAGVTRATYADGYADDVGAAVELGVVQSIPMADGLHAASWWSTTGEGEIWHVHATVVQDLERPGTSVQPDGFDRLHSFSADLSIVPGCAEVVDGASAIACLEAPGATDALELLATLDLAALPWDAMPDDVDPQAGEPWVDVVSADGTIAFSHPESWTVLDQERSADPLLTFLTLVTPDGYEALDVRLLAGTAPPASRCEQPEWRAEMPIALLSSEVVDPVVDAALDPGGLELATFDFGFGDVGVAILPADRVAAGCFDPVVAIGQATFEVSTPYGTDAPGMIYEGFPGGVGFVGSPEHAVMLDVVRSVEVLVTAP